MAIFEEYWPPEFPACGHASRKSTGGAQSGGEQLNETRRSCKVTHPGELFREVRRAIPPTDDLAGKGLPVRSRRRRRKRQRTVFSLPTRRPRFAPGVGIMIGSLNTSTGALSEPVAESVGSRYPRSCRPGGESKFGE